MTGHELIAALKRKFRVSTDNALAAKIGLTIPGIQVWKRRSSITVRQLAELAHKASKAGAKNFQTEALRPIVEFFPTDSTESRQRKNWELFNTKTEAGGTHEYFHGLRHELETNRGVYIFFDSRGRAIYVGKARKQSLWKEMNSAFNRTRGAIQKIKRVHHPRRNQGYTTSNEKARQISDDYVPLHELAVYFSAYEVSDEMISEVEAMLVRSFANDLLNKRMERFGQQRRSAS